MKFSVNAANPEQSMTITHWLTVALPVVFALLVGLAGCTGGSQPPVPPASTRALAQPGPSSTAPPTASPTATPPPGVSTTALPETQAASTQTNPPACQPSTGQIEQQQVETPLLTKPLQFRVYLPPCYSATGERYPVLYLLHGQMYDDAQWDEIGIDETADRLISAEEIPPLIIVMPRETSWQQPTQSNFGQAVVEALVPWVDAHYATRAERESRAVGGLSRGAAWAVHLGLSQWQTFGGLGAHSLPLFWTDSEQLPAWLDAIPEADQPRIYLDIGRSDRDLQSAAGFEALLESRGIPHEWHLYAGYHNEDYWRAHLEDYLRWYSNW